MSDEPRLKVKHGGKVLGPMSIVEVANLMAEGKVAESDLVSDGGPWVSFETYVGGHSEPDASSVTSADVESLFAGEFAIEFDASGTARGKTAAASNPAAGRPAPPSRSKDTLDDDDIIDLLEADDDDADIIDLDLADDEKEASRPTARPPAAGAAKSPPGKAAAAGAKPSPAAGSTAKSGAPSVPGKPSLRPMPLPPSIKGGPGKAPPPLMEADDELDVMEFLSDDPKPAATKPTSPKAPAAAAASTKVTSAPATGHKPPASTAGTSKPGTRPNPPAGKLPEVPPPPAGKGKKESQALNEAHSPNLPPGFKPMFNGRNFSGWEFFPIEDWTSGRADCWKVDGGLIKFDGTARRPHLLSIPEFVDFELFVGWRALKPDWQGGILVRSDSAPSGTRCFISLGAKDAGKLCGVGTSGSKATPALQKPAGEWNVWRIVAVGERIGLWCNQECAWSEATINRPKGKIGLRADGSPLEFKFLHVRELTKK